MYLIGLQSLVDSLSLLPTTLVWSLSEIIRICASLRGSEALSLNKNSPNVLAAYLVGTY